ncbi:MAG: SGNH hydrolase domain-containing protein, partial [Rhodobacterales bacterium]|nr:SGNH hydrolase domain-containing protein [Rhodobacterales bacterium]
WPDVLPEVVVLGDSHAEHLFYGLAEGLPDRAVAMYSQNDVPFLDSRRFAPLFAALQGNPNLKTVVYAMHWPRRFADLEDEAAFERRLGETLGLLQGLGARVLVVGDLPWFASEPPYCKYAVIPGNDRYCTALRTDAEAARLRYNPIIARVTTALGIEVIPLRDLLCDGDACSMAPAGTMLLRDSNHLTVTGSLLLGARIAAAIKAKTP